MRWSLIASVNNPQVLRGSLLRSPDVSAAEEVVLKRGFATAGAAYNAAMGECKGDILVFAHQDVYMPPGWVRCLEERIEQIESVDANWAVLGVFGVDSLGHYRGYVYSTGLGSVLGSPLEAPVSVRSVDEMVIILRRDAKLPFDPRLPGFHLYGTDICLEAIHRKMSCYVISNFCIHNSNGVGGGLPGEFWRAYMFMRAKWSEQLPVTTPCVTITASHAQGAYCWMRGEFERWLNRRTPGARVEDPSLLYESLSSHLRLECTRTSAKE